MNAEQITVRDVIKTGKLDIQDIVAFMTDDMSKDTAGIKAKLSEISGFEVARIAANYNWDTDTILDAEIIDDTPLDL